MWGRRDVVQAPAESPVWGRNRLFAVMAGAVVVVLLLVTGLVLAVMYAVAPDPAEARTVADHAYQAWTADRDADRFPTG